jgi:hypothetical protein
VTWGACGVGGGPTAPDMCPVLMHLTLICEIRSALRNSYESKMGRSLTLCPTGGGHLIFFFLSVLGIELRASSLLKKSSTT